MDYATKEDLLALEERVNDLEARTSAEMRRIEVMFEQMQSQMRFIAEATTAFRDELKRDLAALEERLTVRIVNLEHAVMKNSEDIRKNSDDIMRVESKVDALGAKVDGLTRPS